MGQVTLESFLALNSSFIGIVAPENYLELMGLQLVVDADKQFSLVKTKHNGGPTQGDLTTNLSVNDIVNRCYETGYVTGALPLNNLNSQGAGVAMAVTAQLNPSPTHSKVTDNNKSDAVGTPVTNPPHNPANAIDGTKSDGQDQLRQPAKNNFSATDPKNIHDGGNPKNITPYAAADFDNELQTAMNAFPFAAEDNGYFALFNPSLRTPVLIYNPYRIQSEFDAFDIGDYVDI